MTRQLYELHRGYQRASRNDAPLQRSPALKLVWRSLPGTALLFVLCVAAAFAVAAIG